jgi:peptidyl-tRNA hydrolase, PTH1 family
LKYLIVGLGNIGLEYQNTRHNIGFEVLDALAKASNVFFRQDKLAAVAELKFKGKLFILVKPSTYMNLSGKAVNYWMQKEKIQLENVLVITDDIALPVGALRLRAKGSHGGHNGLRNIGELLATEEYARLRFGVGSDFPKGRQADYVLGHWSPEERVILDERKNACSEMIKSFGTIGLSRTMSLFNNK